VRADLLRRDATIRTSRSSGPGGQHANVTASRVEAVLDVRTTEALNAAERERVLTRLGPTVTAVAQDARSQLRNRELALERLEAKVRRALHVAKLRRATKPTKGSKERRLAEKQRRSAIKRDRRTPPE
jgi:ribosome-associated protein